MLTVKTLRGAIWSVASRVSGRAIDLATLLFLARILSPADFGLVAIANSFVSIAEMILEIPIVQALLRLPKVDKSDLDTAFTIGLLRGILIILLMSAVAWPISLIYNDIRLLPIVLVLSLAPISRSLYSPAMIKFYREISFQQSFVIEFSAKCAGTLISVVCIYIGLGYWSLVVNPVLSSLISMVLSYVLAPYWPNISLKRIRNFSSFTGWFTSSQIISAVGWQYDRVFLGYHIDKSSLGRYGVASDFAVMPTQTLIGPAMRPVMAAFSRISDDNHRLCAAYLKASQISMLIALPTGTGIALTADQIVHVFLGDQWIAASLYLRWLSVAIMFTAFNQPVGSLCLAKNRPDIIFKICVLDLIIKIALMTAGFYIGGIILMIYARIVTAIVVMLIGALYCKHMVFISVYRQIRNIWQIGASCIAMLLFVIALQYALEETHVGQIFVLVTTACSGAIVFGICIQLLGFRLPWSRM